MSKGKKGFKMVRVPILDESSVSERFGMSWCKRHQDYTRKCPCVERSKAEQDGFIIVKIDGQIVGEKRIEL